MYEILDTTPCRYGVLLIGSNAELLDIIEKPDFLTCSDGLSRVRDKSGNIVESMTQPIHDR